MAKRSCGVRHLATRALVLQAIEELARTSKQVLKLRDVEEGFKLDLNNGGVSNTGRWMADPARALASK